MRSCDKSCSHNITLLDIIYLFLKILFILDIIYINKNLIFIN